MASAYIQASLLLGGITFLFVQVIPVVRFIASEKWTGSGDTLGGFIVLALSVGAGSVILLNSDELHRSALRKWERRGKRGRKPENLGDRPISWIALPIFLPLLIWFFWYAVPAVWLPMATIVFDRGPVTQEFVISAKRDGHRSRRKLVLEGHYFIWGAIPQVPNQIWETVEPGDKILLEGTGNAYGVFYETISVSR
ncbi:MAG: hypothetical protein AAGP08_01345 [Pseudomonadota bacterium]